MAMSVQVPTMFTKNTQRPVATAFPLPVFFMRKAMNRSNAGARLTDNANRGTLRRAQWRAGQAAGLRFRKRQELCLRFFKTAVVCVKRTQSKTKRNTPRSFGAETSCSTEDAQIPPYAG